MIEAISSMAMSGGASAVLGASLSTLGKVLAIAKENKALSHARDIDEMKAVSEMMDAAAKRGAGSGAGDWVRRFMVVALFAFMFAFLPLNAIIGHWAESGSVESTFVYTAESGRRLFGLLPGKTEIATTPLVGIPVFKTFVDMGWLMACFYFGSSRIK